MGRGIVKHKGAPCSNDAQKRSIKTQGMIVKHEEEQNMRSDKTQEQRNMRRSEVMKGHRGAQRWG